MHILIINQHGENRGDEAAMQGMLGAVARKYPSAQVTLLYQHKDRSHLPPAPSGVTCLPIVMPLFDAFLLAGAACLRAWVYRGFALTRGPRVAKAIWAAYTQCDMVISAPGGPYFGDLYVNHEFVHVFLVWLGRIHKKRMFLFAPSCGPFGNRLMNPIRRRMFGWFSGVCLREPVSAQYLKGLTGAAVEVTADSAFLAPLQAVIEPAARKKVVTATVLKHRAWQREPERQRAYEASVINALNHLALRHDLEVVFLPQLCGKVHSDFDYLTDVGSRLDTQVRWRVMPRAADVAAQRKLIGEACMSLATRYHHQVFSIGAATPVVALCYEHKSTGLMQEAGMSQLALPIGDVNAQKIVDACEYVLRNGQRVSRSLMFSRVALRRRALHSVRMLSTGEASA
ncbi:putative pyruvyl transferase [Oceanococcus atlanticus]|uniref:Putative pyruvyl transferase n=1 Tax=Oceanococcus atlanticus TaxID=1317117 RepID=A0A1Y1SIJ6_9GAMM|nr:polysaccharide pyruvyl transferase family protein [Oceanococcus atlanticus]ORE89220.1 putative pyruvyl transferase [Oceanococcus atlanticus]